MLLRWIEALTISKWEQKFCTKEIRIYDEPYQKTFPLSNIFKFLCAQAFSKNKQKLLTEKRLSMWLFLFLIFPCAGSPMFNDMNYVLTEVPEHLLPAIQELVEQSMSAAPVQNETTNETEPTAPPSGEGANVREAIIIIIFEHISYLHYVRLKCVNNNNQLASMCKQKIT